MNRTMMSALIVAIFIMGTVLAIAPAANAELYNYDSIGRVSNVVMSGGNIVQYFHYDEMGNITSGVEERYPFIAISPTQHEFGALTASNPSEVKLFQVDNNGAADLTINEIIFGSFKNSAAGDWTVQNDGCAGVTVPIGETCTFEVLYNTQTESWMSTKINFDSDARNKELSITLEGQGRYYPHISVSPASYDYGDVPYDAWQFYAPGGSIRNFEIENNGKDVLNIDSVTIPSSSLVNSVYNEWVKKLDYCSGISLDPNKSCTFSVVFVPDYYGWKSAEVDIVSDAVDNPRFTIALEGKGDNSDVMLEANPSGYDYGYINSPVSKWFEIRNYDFSNTHLITNVYLSNPFDQVSNTQVFFVQTDGCTGQSVNYDYHCSVRIKFDPTGVARVDGYATDLIVEAGTASRVIVPLSGNYSESVNGNFDIAVDIVGPGSVILKLPNENENGRFVYNSHCHSISSNACLFEVASGADVVMEAKAYDEHAALPDGAFIAWTETDGCEVLPLTNKVCSLLHVDRNVSMQALFTSLHNSVDVAYLVDTSGSMWDDIDNVKATIGESFTLINTIAPGSRGAIVDFRDHPSLPYGGPDDYMYNVVKPFTNDVADFISSIENLNLSPNQGDFEESIYTAIVNTTLSKDGLGAWNAPKGSSTDSPGEVETRSIVLLTDGAPHEKDPGKGCVESDDGVTKTFTGCTYQAAIVNANAVEVAIPNEGEMKYASFFQMKPMMKTAMDVQDGIEQQHGKIKIHTGILDGNALDFSETGGSVRDLTALDIVSAVTGIELPVSAKPDCNSAYVDIKYIWPPDFRMVPVTVAGVKDKYGTELPVIISAITQDEPVLGPGAGNSYPDAYGVGTDTAYLRAERIGSETDRIYEINFSATDAFGKSCEGQVKVCVPHDMYGDNTICVDNGQLYDSTGQ